MFITHTPQQLCDVTAACDSPAVGQSMPISPFLSCAESRTALFASDFANKCFERNVPGDGSGMLLL